MSQAESIVVVRTVSVEKLSPVLDACRERWPGCAITVVTNPGRVGELASDPRVAVVVEYDGGADGFAAPIVVPSNPTALVVPVSNRTGSGYANVLRACRKVPAREKFLASHCRKFKRIGRLRWTIKTHWEFAVAIPARWIGRLWATWMFNRDFGRRRIP